MKVVIFGLSITSSWGNGHATTYRALVRALSERGHTVHFLERDVRWYAGFHRDLPDPPFCRTTLYAGLDDLARDFSGGFDADLIIVGSYVPEAVALTAWLRTVSSAPLAFYDIDTPVTLAALDRGECSYLTADSIREYDLFLSFCGGPVLDRLRDEYHAAMVRPLYCSVDPILYYPEAVPKRYDLAYLGTFSTDRQPSVDRLLRDVARQMPESRFALAGAQYPADLEWPVNVERFEHLPPSDHRHFYNSQRFTLNVTRADMIANGYSPSVRLFEAAACGVPIISDQWPGLDEFLEPGVDIITAESTEDVIEALRMPYGEARVMGMRARERILAGHTAAHRAVALEAYVEELSGASLRPR